MGVGTPDFRPSPLERVLGDVFSSGSRSTSPTRLCSQKYLRWDPGVSVSPRRRGRLFIWSGCRNLKRDQVREEWKVVPTTSVGWWNRERVEGQTGHSYVFSGKGFGRRKGLHIASLSSRVSKGTLSITPVSFLRCQPLPRLFVDREGKKGVKT